MTVSNPTLTPVIVIDSLNKLPPRPVYGYTAASVYDALAQYGKSHKEPVKAVYQRGNEYYIEALNG